MRSIATFAVSAVALALAVVAVAGCGGGGNGATTSASGIVTVDVEIKDGKPVGGIQRATATNGQTVAIVVHSDVADEVHVHGYDLHHEVEAGGTVRIQFTANLTGVFEAELESRSLQIVELTVKP